MINPFTGDNKVYTLREVFFEENIVQAKLTGRMVVFCTNYRSQFYKFYFIRDIENPVVQEFNHSELRTSFYEGNTNKLFFLPIPPSCSFSTKIECFVNHYKLGALRLIEDETDKYEFVSHVPSSTLKKLPEIKEIQYMALSPIEDTKPKKMALLNTANTLYVIIIDPSHLLNLEIRLPILDELDQEVETEKKLFWCGNTSLIVVCGRFYVLVTLDKEYKRQLHRAKGFVVIPELDCVRIFSNEKCEILKLVPELYTKIFLPTSRARAADLYNAFLENEEKNPSPENNVIEDKKGLEEGVRDILDAVYFEVNTDDQKVLLKAAAYGKAFLNKSNSSFKHDYFTEVCKNLRVVNSLKSCKIARCVTYSQFLYLDSIPRQFMGILMKYHLFYLADEIAKFLGYAKEIVSQIYITWACCKIDNHPNDENIAEKIFERLKNDDNASYVEVAHKAHESSSAPWETNKKNLSLKIIQYEPSIQKKVTFLLWVEQYEQALIESAKSLDPNLIDLVILKLAKDTEAGVNFWKMVSENPRTRPRLFKYVYDFKYQRIQKAVLLKKKAGDNKGVPQQEDMDSYLEKFASNDERAAHFFWRCFAEQNEVYEDYQDPKDKKVRTIKKLEPLADADKMNLLEKASKLKIKNGFMAEAVEMYRKYLKEDKGQQPERPVIEVLKEKAMINKEGEIAKKYKISERVAFIAKLRSLMDQPDRFRQNEAIDKLLEEKNKKGDLVSYYEVVNMMIEYGMTERAEKYAMRIKNWDEQLFMLKYIATTNSINIAIDLAADQKRVDDLVDLGRFIEQVGASPGKYPNLILNEGFMQKIEKGLTGKR